MAPLSSSNAFFRPACRSGVDVVGVIVLLATMLWVVCFGWIVPCWSDPSGGDILVVVKHPALLDLMLVLIGQPNRLNGTSTIHKKIQKNEFNQTK